MITKLDLEQLKSIEIDDVDIAKLKDIRNVHVDTDIPVIDRVISFMLQIGNPYLFKVGDTPVKVRFAKNGPTLQKCLEIFFAEKY